MRNELLGEKLVLASTSPRRAEILRAVGWPFEALAPDVDETRAPDEDAVVYVKRLARAKAEAVAGKRESRLVLGADTVVVIGSEILGQPRDAEDARRMLRLLSGEWHEVLTGVALLRAGKEDRCLVEHESTRVQFSRLSNAEIDWYVRSGEPMGKAGAYAIQGLASKFVERIDGCYFNVVGLPLARLCKELAELGWSEEQA